jgi:hypothetical protein
VSCGRLDSGRAARISSRTAKAVWTRLIGVPGN